MGRGKQNAQNYNNSPDNTEGERKRAPNDPHGSQIDSCQGRRRGEANALNKKAKKRNSGEEEKNGVKVSRPMRKSEELGGGRRAAAKRWKMHARARSRVNGLMREGKGKRCEL